MIPRVISRPHTNNRFFFFLTIDFFYYFKTSFQKSLRCTITWCRHFDQILTSLDDHVREVPPKKEQSSRDSQGKAYEISLSSYYVNTVVHMAHMILYYDCLNFFPLSLFMCANSEDSNAQLRLGLSNLAIIIPNQNHLCDASVCHVLFLKL